jgi:hypothetical protein
VLQLGRGVGEKYRMLDLHHMTGILNCDWQLIAVFHLII